MAHSDIHVGLEIGTTKVSAVVAECGPDGEIHVLGVGETPSRGVRKGEIIDMENASKCVRDALEDAEEKSDHTIDSVWLAVTGGHVESLNHRVIETISDHTEGITDEEIRRVELRAGEIPIPPDNDVLHSIIQQYYVDGQNGVIDPVGMLGSRLEADYHIIHGVKRRIQNAIRCVQDVVHIEVQDVVANSYASAAAVLNQHQREAGTLVLDIGGGVTDYIVYRGGIVRHSGVLAIGGDHINSDISLGLRLPLSRAERLKTDEGNAQLGKALPGQKIVLKNDSGFSGKDVEREMLNTIINARVEELFQLIQKSVSSVVPLDLLGAGVLLTGGCSRLRGIREVAEQVFDIPVRLAHSQEVSGLLSAFENPRLSTCIGLVKYAQAVHSEMQERSLLSSFFNKVKRSFPFRFAF